MDRTERTRLEMEAGARQLAIVQGKPLSPDYLAAVIRTQERDAQLRRWVTANKVKVNDPLRYQAGSVRYKRDGEPEHSHNIIKVLPDGPEFTDIDAERTGGYPSEVLIANIALYLQSVGNL